MKKLTLFIVALIVVGVAAFWGGRQYEKNKISSQRAGFQNLPLEQRQQIAQRAGRMGANFLSGEIINKDEKSLTIKLRDGSTKIVFFSDATQVNKMAEGSLSDLEVGQQVMVSGEGNSDGSFTAKSIQLSPRFLEPNNTGQTK